MRIIFDGTIFTRRMTGIGSNAKNIVNAIIKYRPDIELIVLTPRRFHVNFINFEEKIKDKIVIKPLLSPRVPSVLWFNLYLWNILHHMKADVFLTPMTQYPLVVNKRTKYVVIVNDLVIKDFKDTMEWKSRLYDTLVFDRSVKHAKKLWCISEYTHQNLFNYYNCTGKKFFVNISVDPIFQKIKISTTDRQLYLSSLGIKDKFLLFVGSVEPRKNMGFLLKIAPKVYKETGIQTLIIGANQWGKTYSDYDKNAVVFVKRFIDIEDLVKLYNLASCYISTSLDEGFGMPQLEAMKCGCPVISPNNSAMTEVVSGYGTLVVGWNEEEWLRAIVSEMSRDHEPYTGEKYNWKHIIDNFIEFCKS